MKLARLLLALLLFAPFPAQADPLREYAIKVQANGRRPLDSHLEALRLRRGSPVFIRIYKRERQLELFMQRRNGGWVLVRRYPICAWSGRLGPKLREGDGQAPEGFYVVGRKQLKPDSQYHRAFNLGYPNERERALGRTGSFLMVHGACVSIGCYAMTDVQITEIYDLVSKALAAGQPGVPVEAYPFVMRDEALERERSSPWYAEWAELQRGWKVFEGTGQPATAYACGGRYRFSPAAGCRRIAPWR